MHYIPITDKNLWLKRSYSHESVKKGNLLDIENTIATWMAHNNCNELTDFRLIEFVTNGEHNISRKHHLKLRLVSSQNYYLLV